MSLAAVKNHFVNWREWEINPILIKELRQGVRNAAVTGMLMLFLIVLFLISLGYLISESFEVSPNSTLGRDMLEVFMMTLAGASVFFIPLYLGTRVAAERQENNPDLLYVSTLPPWRIILGKFLCGAYVTILFFSACMPFMAFTNLLRGVDLPTVFIMLGVLFLVVCAMNMVAIFLACLPVSRPFKFLFLIYGIGQSVFIMMGLAGIGFELMRGGVGSRMFGPGFWPTLGAWIGYAASAIGLFFVLAVALISPPSANRALPVRAYVTGIWFVAGLVNWYAACRTGEIFYIMPWAWCTFAIMLASLVVVISNNDQLSPRVRRAIPQAKRRRALAFLFYNGAAGGLVWIALICILTYALITLTAGWMSTSSGFRDAVAEFRDMYVPILIYAFAYALTALLIQRTFFSKRPAKITGLLVVLLAGLWALVPSLVLFFMNRLSWRSAGNLELGNIFNVAMTAHNGGATAHLLFGSAWLLLVLILSFRWFRRQANAFVPLSPTE